MAWALVQCTYATSNAATFASTTTADSLLVVFLFSWTSGGGNEPTNVTDNNGQTFIKAVATVSSDSKSVSSIYYKVNAAGAKAGHIVTANFGTGNDYDQIFIHEFTGNDSGSCLDQATGVFTTPGSSGTNGNTTPSVTTTTDGQLIFGAIHNNSDAWTGVTAGTSPITFTEAQENSGHDRETEYGTQTSAGAITAKWTCSNTNDYIAQIATFKAPAGGTTILRQMMQHHGG